jgi:hypothetical protein
MFLDVPSLVCKFVLLSMLYRLSIPERMLPDKKLQTVRSAIHAEIPTILNVLVDQVGFWDNEQFY